MNHADSVHASAPPRVGPVLHACASGACALSEQRRGGLSLLLFPRIPTRVPSVNALLAIATAANVNFRDFICHIALQ